jgi:long-subunit acyl-CoA synthetase (AMP-forming)
LDEKGAQKAQGELGEVCIRGANVTLGYYNNPSANEANFTKDGWFRTGDQGYAEKEKSRGRERDRGGIEGKKWQEVRGTGEWLEQN